MIPSPSFIPHHPVGEYRRWEERVWKAVGEVRVMQWGRGGELRRGEGKVR